MTIGERIRERRTALGLTQNDVARRASMYPQDITRFEGGYNKPSVDALHRIATALNTDPNYLMGWPDAQAQAISQPSTANQQEAHHETGVAVQTHREP